MIRSMCFPKRLAVLVSMSALLVSGAAFAGGDARPVVDELNGVRLTVPGDWRVSTPNPDGLMGATTLMSFGPEAIPEGEPQENYFPEGGVKIDIRTTERLVGEDLDSWKTRRFDDLFSQKLVKDAHQPVAYRIAGRDAVAYTVTAEGIPTALDIDMVWSQSRFLNFKVMPATSTALAEALEVLDGVLAEGQRPHKAKQSREQLMAPLAEMLSMAPRYDNTKAGSCPGGTFPGTEAHQISSSHTLQMPFEASGSYYWQAGNVGSFYGNGAHCNSNSDYYAIDWNRYSNSNCTTDAGDGGETVKPVYDGSIQFAGWTDDGYGYNIRVTHSIGGVSYRSRYAHLSTITVSSGSVSANTKIGEVGTTGNSNGDHLHMSFQEHKNGDYRSLCYNGGANCANGEAPAWPQTAKPSKMATHQGNVNIVDYGCYRSVNNGGGGGGGGGWTQTVDDSQAYLGGPSQYWWQVWGYGQNNQMHYTYSEPSSGTNFIYWYFNVPTSGNYKVEVYIPSNHATTQSARYWVHNGSSWVGPYVVNQNIYYNQWVTLTNSVFLNAGSRIVYVGDVTGEASGSRKVGVDAARVTQN